MKRPKKIRKGDIFVDDVGVMRIILDTAYYVVHVSYESFCLFENNFKLKDFKENTKHISEYYLGNITDIKPNGKF